MAIQLKIKEEIEKAGLTQAQVAEALGRGRSTLHKIITNGNPSLNTLAKLAEVIGVPISHLYDEGGDKEELTALIYHKGTHYRATTLEELKKIVSDIENNEPLTT